MGSRKAPYFCIASYPTRVPGTQQTRCLRQFRGLHGLTEAIRRHMTRCLRLMKPEAYTNSPAIDDSDNHLIMNREKFDIRRGGKKEVKKRFRERKPCFFLSQVTWLRSSSRVSSLLTYFCALNARSLCKRGTHYCISCIVYIFGQGRVARAIDNDSPGLPIPSLRY
jgi:hypothetical protein